MLLLGVVVVLLGVEEAAAGERWGAVADSAASAAANAALSPCWATSVWYRRARLARVCLVQEPGKAAPAGVSNRSAFETHGELSVAVLALAVVSEPRIAGELNPTSSVASSTEMLLVAGSGRGEGVAGSVAAR